ncbi:MAG: 30S ribosomal protein S4 [Candidatus Omnitrophica bacterium CG1_02_46_14]|nr:MAG: 30S ribosomal protein S4 [Candidatus Omnitrophica bacterium CG1_02_46_14]
MARYTASVCRLCRREKIKLFLKGTRCYTPKCAVEKREYVPGMHGQGRQKLSDYGVQLREKQKVKRIYGVLERQFKFYFRNATRSKGVTGATLLITLERRLDNAVYRMGIVGSRSEARQVVRHGHVIVNKHQVNIPSSSVNVNDVIEVKATDKMVERFKTVLEQTKDQKKSDWLEMDAANFTAKVKKLPERSDIQTPIQEQLIVELYSK